MSDRFRGCFDDAGGVVFTLERSGVRGEMEKGEWLSECCGDGICIRELARWVQQQKGYL